MKKLYLLICAALLLPFVAFGEEVSNGTISEGFENMSFNLTTQNSSYDATTSFKDRNGNPGSISWHFVRTTDAASSTYFKISSGGNGGNCLQSMRSSSANTQYNHVFVEVKKGTVSLDYRAYTNLWSATGIVKVYKANVDKDAKSYTLTDDVIANFTSSSTTYSEISFDVSFNGWICLEITNVYLDNYTNVQSDDTATISGKVFYLDENGNEVAVKGVYIAVGETTVTSAEDGTYSLECYKGERTLTVTCPDQGGESFGLPNDGVYTINVDGDMTLNFQVFKGASGTVTKTYGDYTFDDWSLASSDSSILSNVNGYDAMGWGYLSYSSDPVDYVNLSSTGDDKYLRGGNNNPDMVIFPVFGSSVNGCTVSFDARSEIGSTIEFYLVTKDGNDWVKGDKLATFDVDGNADENIWTPYSFTTTKITSGEVQYIGVRLYRNARLNNLKITYDSTGGVIAHTTVTGTVTDAATNTAIANATVKFIVTYEPDTTKEYTATTDSDGEYNFGTDGIAANVSYSVKATASGYEDYTSQNNVYISSESNNYDIKLNKFTYVLNVAYSGGVASNTASGNGEAPDSRTAYVYLYNFDGKPLSDSYYTATFTSKDDAATEQVNDVEDLVPAKAHAVMRNYYQVGSDGKGVNMVDVSVNNSTINMVKDTSEAHQDDTQSTIVINGNEESGYTYIKVALSDHTLKYNDKGGVVLKVNTNTGSKSSRMDTSSSIVEIAMIAKQGTGDDADKILVYRDWANSWQINLGDNQYNSTLYFPEGSITYDEYDYDLDKEYELGIVTGISRIGDTDSQLVDVYTVQGVVVKLGAEKNMLQELPAGIYIVRSKQGTFKFIQK